MNEQKHSRQPVIVSQSCERLSPWLQLVSKEVRFPWLEDTQIYLSVKPYDYVGVLAQTSDGKILLVRQYRPVVEGMTLELPGGLIDPGETPEQAGRRELLEETGHRADKMVHLGTILPDVGRLENRQWCYWAPDVQAFVEPASTEEGVEVVLCDKRDLYQMVRDGRMPHALHIAVLTLASLKGKWVL